MHLVIIGNGISGISCATTFRKRKKDPVTVISSESDHFFSRTALMYVYMGHLRFRDTKPYADGFWEQNHIRLVRDRVNRILPQEKALELDSGATIHYDVLVLASGSHPKLPGIPGEDLPGVQGLYHLQDLERMEEQTHGIRQAVVIGGGLIGVELAEMLRSRGIAVSFLVRESGFWNVVLPEPECDLIGEEIRRHGIDLRLSTRVTEILPDETGKVAGVLTESGERIPASFVGLTIGVTPNVGYLSDSGLDTETGILVDHGFRTNLPDVYAIGDCAQFRQALPGRRALEQVWYTGRLQGQTLGQILAGEDKTYDPGPWFNSAKFFDIEYQAYGHIPPTLPSGSHWHCWVRPDRRACLRLMWETGSGRLQGIHALGLRLRQEVCESWILEGRLVEAVVQDLQAAAFDPEFSRSWYPAIRDSFQEAMSSARKPGTRNEPPETKQV